VHPLAAITAPFFPSLALLGEFEEVLAANMPREYQVLLAHNEHMTVAVEAHHAGAVDVQVLDSTRDGDFYTRSSLLTRQSDGAAVQLGIMRIDMSRLSAAVRQEIESRTTPLGRILIRHDVLRQVELERLWRIKPGPVLRQRLGLEASEVAYGRSARIVVEGRRAVELLEIPKA
jgi:chorismate-pyruvate lyase